MEMSIFSITVIPVAFYIRYWSIIISILNRLSSASALDITMDILLHNVRLLLRLRSGIGVCSSRHFFMSPSGREKNDGEICFLPQKNNAYPHTPAYQGAILVRR